MFDIEGQTYTIIKRFRIEIIFVAIALIIPIFSFFYLTSVSADNDSPTEIEFKSSKEKPPEQSKIYIDISGAVNNPDVYEVVKGTRLGQVIELAGGISEEADKVYVSKNFNKAKTLSDQDKIYIPTSTEITNGNYVLQKNSTLTQSTTTDSPRLVNINEASILELETLPGIGQTTANKIADNRPYTAIDELQTKKVVSSSVFTKIKALITL